MNVLASQHHTHAGVTRKNIKYKMYHTLPWLNTAVKCNRVADYNPKISCITMGAEYHGNMYQRVADYHPKNAVHYRGAEYHGSMYQSGRLPSKKYRAHYRGG